MPGKSRRGRGKHSARSKKKHGTQVRVARLPVAAETYKPAAPVVPSPVPLGTSTGTRYPYIVKELRRIGILAGIMLAILIILALSLP
jgi:hypothetical protein